MIDYSSITSETLQQLIDNQVAEDNQLEYKAYTFLKGKIEDKDKVALLKEITAFANSNGGIIIIGIDEEDKGVASKIVDVGCPSSDFDSIQLALQQAILAKVRPRLYGIDMKCIIIDNDRFVMIIFVPKSFNKPHAFNDGNKDNFYIRHSNGVGFMSIDDLRKQFIFSASYKNEIKSFRQERIGMILGNECIGDLSAGAKILLHIIPLWSLDAGNNVDIKLLCKAPYKDNITPISGSGWYSRYNSDGYCLTSKNYETKNINSYSQIFRNGIIEALDIRMMNYNNNFERHVYDWRKTENSIYEALVRFSDVLKSLDIPKPWYIYITLLDAKGFRSDSFYYGTTESIDRDIIHATECNWEDDNVTLSDIIRPTFDSLANCFGMAQSPNYDPDSKYIIR